MFEEFKRYRRVYQYLWKTYGSSWHIRFSYLLQFIGRICKLIFLPVAISLVITGLSNQDYSSATKAVLLFASASLALGIITPLVKYIGMLGENKIYRDATASYFFRLITTDLEYFHSNLSGYLTTATRQFVDNCLVLVRTLRERYISTLLSILFPLVVIFWLDLWLGLVALVLSLTQATYLIWASQAIGPFRARARELYRENSGRMADVISNILAVRSTAQEKTYAARVREAADKESEVYSKRYAVQSKLIAAREFITVLFFMILLWLTVQRMSGDFIDITAAVLVVTYTTTIMTGIYSLSEDLDEHDEFIDKIIPGFEILNRKNAVSDPPNPVPFEDIQGKIAFNNVSFSYHKGQDRFVLKNFSLHIPQGQKVGIVGLSGAGKTTLTKLLLRFNDVDEGTICIDGIDLRHIKQSDLHTTIAYVPQEPLLLHTSIKDNVLLSHPEATEDEIYQALKAAHAFDFVHQLPKGIDSVVGERGVKLSGGQKQRIAIARAVLQQTPIMILDEATSALDSESEQIIKDSFADILKNKTAIVVAHRLSTLSDMDRIIVIEDGKLAEDGTHNDLLAQDGIYTRLWKHQQRRIET